MATYRVVARILMSFCTDIIVSADSEDEAHTLAEALVDRAIEEDGAQSLKTYDEQIENSFIIRVKGT